MPPLPVGSPWCVAVAAAAMTSRSATVTPRGASTQSRNTTDATANTTTETVTTRASPDVPRPTLPTAFASTTRPTTARPAGVTQRRSSCTVQACQGLLPPGVHLRVEAQDPPG